MKYFVTDPSASMGIRQLPEARVELRDDGSLTYRTDGGATVEVPPGHWSTDWDKVVRPAYDRLCGEILAAQAQIAQLVNAREDLIESSPTLQRLTKQLNLF